MSLDLSPLAAQVKSPYVLGHVPKYSKVSEGVHVFVVASSIFASAILGGGTVVLAEVVCSLIAVPLLASIASLGIIVGGIAFSIFLVVFSIAKIDNLVNLARLKENTAKRNLRVFGNLLRPSRKSPWLNLVKPATTKFTSYFFPKSQLGGPLHARINELKSQNRLLILDMARVHVENKTPFPRRSPTVVMLFEQDKETKRCFPLAISVNKFDNGIERQSDKKVHVFEDGWSDPNLARPLSVVVESIKESEFNIDLNKPYKDSKYKDPEAWKRHQKQSAIDHSFM